MECEPFEGQGKGRTYLVLWLRFDLVETCRGAEVAAGEHVWCTVRMDDEHLALTRKNTENPAVMLEISLLKS